MNAGSDVEPYDRVDIVEIHSALEGHTKTVFTASRMHSDERQMLANEGRGNPLNKPKGACTRTRSRS